MEAAKLRPEQAEMLWRPADLLARQVRRHQRRPRLTLSDWVSTARRDDPRRVVTRYFQPGEDLRPLAHPLSCWSSAKPERHECLAPIPAQQPSGPVAEPHSVGGALARRVVADCLQVQQCLAVLVR